MRPSNYYRPKTIEETLILLAQPDTTPLGGGTKLLAGDVSQAVVDLQALGLDQLHVDKGKLHIGAMVRLVDWAAFLAANNEAGTPAGLLGKAIQQAGPNTYRNAATVGGTIAARLPDSELVAAMLVLEATLLLLTPDPLTLSLADYLAGEIRPNNLITEIQLAWEPGKGGSERVARTPADYPIVSVTAWQPDGRSPRLAATGIDVRPVRLERSEAVLSPEFQTGALETAAAKTAEYTHHPGDFRGDASYRRDMAAVLTRRVLQGINAISS